MKIEHTKLKNYILSHPMMRDAKCRYVVGIDWTLTADKHRFYIFDTQEDKFIYSWFTSHGSGSGGLRKADKFSNVPNSHHSSLGVMKTAETYQGKYGYSLRLDGLEPGINDKVRDRAVVIHPAPYITESYVEELGYSGRSWGCITLNPDDSKYIIDILKGGSLIFNYKP